MGIDVHIGEVDPLFYAVGIVSRLRVITERREKTPIVILAAVRNAAGGRPEGSPNFPVDATLTADVGRRLQAELHAGTHLEDSLWRENHQVQVSAASLKLTASALDVLDLSAWGGATQDHYPTAEAQAAGGAPLSRDDLLLTAGGSVALHPGRLRVSASYDHSERQSSYPGLAWKENRCVFTAFAIW